MDNSGGIFVFNAKIILLIFAVLPPPNYFVAIFFQKLFKILFWIKARSRQIAWLIHKFFMLHALVGMLIEEALFRELLCIFRLHSPRFLQIVFCCHCVQKSFVRVSFPLAILLSRDIF